MLYGTDQLPVFPNYGSCTIERERGIGWENGPGGEGERERERERESEKEREREI